MSVHKGKRGVFEGPNYSWGFSLSRLCDSEAGWHRRMGFSKLPVLKLNLNCLEAFLCATNNSIKKGIIQIKLLYFISVLFVFHGSHVKMCYMAGRVSPFQEVLFSCLLLPKHSNLTDHCPFPALNQKGIF